MIVGFDEYKNKYDFSNVVGVIHVGRIGGQKITGVMLTGAGK
jgi:hypothetical protein